MLQTYRSQIRHLVSLQSRLEAFHVPISVGVVTNSNITLVNEVSGILGLGFSRQSEIYAKAANGMWFDVYHCKRILTSAVLHERVVATPFFSTLAEQGVLDYPVFGLSLTRNATGTLTLGKSLPGA